MDKIFYGDVQPNHKEHKIWVNSKGVIKTYNNEEDKWVELTNDNQPSEGGSSVSTPEMSSFSVESKALGVLNYQCYKGESWASWAYRTESEKTYEIYTVENDVVSVMISYDITSEYGQIKDVYPGDIIEENKVYQINYDV